MSNGAGRAGLDREGGVCCYGQSSSQDVVDELPCCPLGCEGFLTLEKDSLSGEVADEPNDIVVSVLSIGNCGSPMVGCDMSVG